MLVLRRRKGEKLMIQAGGMDIEVSVLDIEKSNIKLGIQADKEVIVVRSELSGKDPVAT